MKIKILGPGCPNCKKLEAKVKDAVSKMNIDASIEKVTEMQDIMEYDIMSSPGLVVDDKVVMSGKLPSVDRLIEIFNCKLNKSNRNNTDSESSCGCGGSC